MVNKVQRIDAVNWNIAAVNNNPFEYWVTHPNPAYNEMMRKIQNLVDCPSEHDLQMSDVFTNSMCRELLEEMRLLGLSGTEEVDHLWNEDYSRRRAISDFLLDDLIGVKRLISMPDRITNTINNLDGSTALRPSVISTFEGEMGTREAWWSLWKEFMFKTTVQVLTKTGGAGPKVVCNLIEPILRSKYPAISLHEQAVSIPLQVLCLALFDAVLLFVLNRVAQNSWQEIKKTLTDGLVKNKCQRTCAVLAETYHDAQIIFIQEAAAAFQRQVLAEPKLSSTFIILRPNVLDGKRDQNSFILARREHFVENSATEITEEVINIIGGSWIAPGDLIAVTIQSHTDQAYLLASFHGDSNGLSTQPFVQALDTLAKSAYPSHIVIVGLDANTHTREDKLHFGVNRFHSLIQSLGMTSCWGDKPDPTAATTCNGRTCLQSQLNKAVRFEERTSDNHKNLKDWIIFYRHHFSATITARDNTGNKVFIRDMVFPTIEFPSDHAVVSTSLLPESVCSAKPGPGSVTCDFDQISRADSRPLANSGAQARPIGAMEGILSSDDELDVLEELCDAVEASEPRTPEFRPQRSPQQAPATLYDYWNIMSKPDELQDPTLPGRGQAVWSLDDSDGQHDFLEEQFLHLTQRSPEVLSKISMSLSSVSSKESSIWLLFTSNPLSLAICKPWFQALHLTVVMMILAWCAVSIDLLNMGGVVSNVHSFRFTVEGLENANSSPLANITGTGLLFDGNPIEQGLLHISNNGTSIIFTSSTLISCNGWWFREDLALMKDFPTRFLREHSVDGVVWQRTPQSVWDADNTVLGRLNSQVVIEIVANQATVLIDYRPPWDWVVGNTGCLFSFGLGNVIAVMNAVRRHGREGVLAMACCCCVALCLRTVCFVGSVSNARYADSLLLGLWILHDVFCCAFLTSAERFLLPALLGLSGFYVLIEAVDTNMIHLNQPDKQYWFYEITPMRCCILSFVCLFCFFTYIRHSSVLWVRAIVQNDQALYESTWENYLSNADSGSLSALDELRQNANRIHSKLEVDVRQRLRKLPSIRTPSVASEQGKSSYSLSVIVSKRGALKTGAHGPLVTSLDQLYAQAAGMQTFLLTKVQHWALACKGCFMVRTQAGERKAIRWDSLLKDPASLARVQWPKLKSPERALEKLLRSYQNDPSRLLDCCRQWIVFEEAEHLLECLQAIERDRDVVIERVKNRLHAGYDAGQTAGYRDVMLNLRVVTDDTRRLGIETHICEVQLSLRCLAELKTNERHARYLVFRNLRSSHKSLNSVLFRLDLASRARSYLKTLFPHSNRVANVLTGSNRVDSTGTTPRITAVAGAGTISDVEEQSDPPEQVNKEQERSTIPFVVSSNVERPRQTHRKAWMDNRRSQFLRHVLEKTYASRCQNEFAKLDQKIKNVHEVIGQASTASLLSTGTPIAASLSRTNFRSFLICISLIFALQLGREIVALQSNGVVTGQHFKLTIARNGTMSNSSVALGKSLAPFPVDYIEWLYNGFKIPDSNKSITMSDESMTISFSVPVQINGWRLFPTKSGYDSVVEFSLESSPDRLAWNKIVTRRPDALRYVFYSKDVGQEIFLFSPRDSFVTFDLRLGWHFAVETVVVLLVDCTMTAALAVSGATGHSRCGRWILGLCSFIDFLCFAASGAGHLYVGQASVSFSVWMLACGKLYMSIIAIFFERLVRSMILFHGLLMLFNDGIEACVIRTSSCDIKIAPPLLGFTEVLVWSCIALMQLSSYFQAKRITERDKLRYDNVWAQVLANDATSHTLTSILELTDRISAKTQSVVLQYNRRLSAFSNERERRFSCAEQEGGNPNRSIPVASLDQLYAQAVALHPMLRWKVQDWALASNGCFPVKSAAIQHVFMRWELLLKDPSSLPRVQWPKLKSPERALEKLLRSYRNDPSRLLDCCRQWIVFEEAEHLLECLQAIERDRDVVIERVKNRLHAGYDAGQTAGYRDVMLNLRVVTDDTRRLGLETHVCEVQLVLVPFAHIKTSEGHQRYIMFRDKRGL